MDLPDSVHAAIVASFGGRRAGEVEMMLPAPDHLALSPPYERVLLAIVGLADGDVGRVAQYTRAAIADWRDVLYWWETPDLAAAASERMDELLRDLEERDD